MKMHPLLQIFLLFCFSGILSTSRANVISSVDASLGFTSLNLSTTGYSKSLSSPSLIEMNYLLWMNNISGAIVVSFSELLQGEGKTVPMSQLGLGYRYYPLGFNGSRVILDQGVIGRIWKSTPFLGLNVSMVNISVEEFNASLIAISPRFGVEMPISSSLFLQASLVFNTASSTGSSDRAVSYSGFSALLGLTFMDF